MSFSQRQKILKCLWSKILSCKSAVILKKSNYGLNLSIILMFLTIYGNGKSQCDRSMRQGFNHWKYAEANEEILVTESTIHEFDSLRAKIEGRVRKMESE